MTELYPSDADLNDLSGTNDAEQEVVYPSIYEAPYYTTFYKMLFRLLDTARRAGDLRVYKDGALTFGVRTGRFSNGDSFVSYAGTTEQALTNESTNYIFLTPDGTLTVNTTAFPNPSVTPHIRLATITPSGGTYGHADIVDWRGAAFVNVLGGMPPTATAWRLLIPQLQLTGVDGEDGTGTMTIQVKDAAGDPLTGYFLVRVWVAETDWKATPDAQSDFSVTTGSQKEEIAADGEYLVQSAADGAIVMNIETATDKTVYVMAECNGMLFHGSVAITGN